LGRELVIGERRWRLSDKGSFSGGGDPVTVSVNWLSCRRGLHFDDRPDA
jgi:hypothetical protein